MDTAQVQSHFRAQVAEYGELMRRIIPFYGEQRDLLVSLIPFERDADLSILDLGCGPGLFTHRLRREYPNARLTAFELTEEMLSACQGRMGADPLVAYRLGDFRTDDFGTGYDVIVASLSLHHLQISERPSFYAKALRSLRPGGRLLAAEVIVDEDAEVREEHHELWRRFMRSNAEDSDSWFAKHLAKDHPMTLSDIFERLNGAGFRKVGCAWKCFNFAIVTAEKSAA